MGRIAIDNTRANPLNTLDGIYTQILSIKTPSYSSPEILSQFHIIVSTTVLLQDPLPLETLANLPQTDINDVKGTLLHLQSIIWLSGLENTPWIYHISFSDFITDAQCCSNVCHFCVQVGLQHGCIAQNCSQVMDEQLHANICNLKFIWIMRRYSIL